MKKRGISLLLAIAMVLTVICSTFVQSFANNVATADGTLKIEDGKLVVSNIQQETFYHTDQVFSGDYTVEMRARVNNQAVGLLLGQGGNNAAMWSLATVNPLGVWVHPMNNWAGVVKVPFDQVQNGRWVTLKVAIQGTTATTYLNDQQVHQYTVPEGSTDGPIGLRFSTTESADLDYLKVYQDGKTIWEDSFNKIDSNKWDFPAPQSGTTGDGRVWIDNGQLVVPSGGDVTYTSKQNFSGDYTIEMKATVHNQAAGLCFGSGSPNPPLWILALVDPYGLWAHQPGNWTVIDKVASDQVKTDTPVTMKIDIKGTTVTTYLNNQKVHECQMDQATTSGPLKLRFAATESADIDYVRVTQNGQITWQDEFEFIDTTKWDFVPPADDVASDVPESYMEPIWEGTTAYEESVWPIAEQDGTVKDIPLLYHADKILTVQNLARTITYQEGKDYTLVDGKLHIPEGSSIPVTSYDTYHPSTGAFPDGDGGYVYWEEGTGIVTRQIYVTYQHSDTWQGEKPADKSNLLPKTIQRLENREDLNIVFYGDSITEGYNTSSFVNTAPYMPKWSTLVTESLKKAYPLSNITEVNTGLSGQETPWGVQNITERVTNYDPDLVVLAFGMNDAGQHRSPQEYVANLQAMIDAIHAKNPDCEIVLVSTTLPNPNAPGFQGEHEAYEQPMLAMEQEGVVVANMTAMHKALIEKKSFENMTGNNVNHPNDYLARVYAQVIYQTAFGEHHDDIGDLNDVSYVEGSNDPYQTLDIELPENMSGPVPVLVFIHGGAWVIGDKTDEELGGILDAALAEGYATVRVNYRLAQNAQWPAQIYDCKAAIRFIRANAETYHLNPDQIAVMGCSAGGHLVQMMGVTNGNPEFEDLSMGNTDVSSDVQAVVSMYGISDISTWHQSEEQLGNIIGNGKDPISMLIGDNYTTEQALAVSPITYVSSNTAPMFIGHGKNDTLVDVEQSFNLAEKVKENIDPELVDTYFPENAAHAQHDAWNNAETIKVTLNFLQKRFFPEQNLDSDENTRPGYWNVDLSGYQNKYIGLQYADQSPTQKLHLVLPDEGEGPFPVVVFVHGGGFAGGNSTGSSVLYTAEGALQALDRGYAVAMVDYRYSPEGYFPEPIYDVKAAIRYLRANAENYHLDSANFAIWGESAGGCIVDFVGTTNGNPAYEDLSMGNAEYSSEVQAVVSWYAITDLATDRNAQYRAAWLGSNAGNMDVIKDSSPINHVTKDAPAFYLQHGMADNEVDYQDSVRLYESLVEATGNPNTTLELFPGITHAVKKFLQPNNVSKIVDWLDEVLVFSDDTQVDKTALETLYNQVKDTDLNQYVDGEAKDTFVAELEKAKNLIAN
ncbi:alpha/beta hydrolase fold domain-containing protein, partial [Massilioclostridium coli]|uniref:alpha/beta hydrolase fold domain-containing protein n=1 Tax=Massilioclostridium coli TaxID=1870991 RepID=UPI0022E2BF4F